MRHWILDTIGSLSTATHDTLESAVDSLILEHEASGPHEYLEQQLARAEALAVISHEFRRRTPTTDEGRGT